MDDPGWTLGAGDWRCVVSPSGASLRRLWLEPAGRPARDILWGYTATAGKRGGQGDVLMPFPGRTAGGAYTFGGARHELPRNDKEGPNAIHGFLRGRAWEGDHTASTARFRIRISPSDHPGYPFDLEVLVGYELLPSGLACAFTVRNAGDRPAPFGAGFHPYVATAGGVDAARLRLPASLVVELDAGLLPTGRVRPVPPELDFRAPRQVGPLRLNHCFTGLAKDADGFLRAQVDDVELWMDGSFPYLVVYSGDALGPDGRKALAVEPMTCATDALNHPGWGLATLQPGQAAAGTWGVALAPGARAGAGIGGPP